MIRFRNPETGVVIYSKTMKDSESSFKSRHNREYDEGYSLPGKPNSGDKQVQLWKRISGEDLLCFRVGEGGAGALNVDLRGSYYFGCFLGRFFNSIMCNDQDLS